MVGVKQKTSSLVPIASVRRMSYAQWVDVQYTTIYTVYTVYIPYMVFDSWNFIDYSVKKKFQVLLFIYCFALI